TAPYCESQRCERRERRIPRTIERLSIPKTPTRQAFRSASEAPAFLVSVQDPMNDGDVREHHNHPKHRGHAVEQGAYQDEYDAFGPLEETHFARRDEVLGARAAVARHYRPDHRHRHQHHVPEAVDTAVID